MMPTKRNALRTHLILKENTESERKLTKNILIFHEDSAVEGACAGGGVRSGGRKRATGVDQKSDTDSKYLIEL